MLNRLRAAPIVAVLVLAVLFGIAYGQYPLYYHTQNQYFFQGLARAGVGHLQEDWFAKTPDPWPLFSRLVAVTYHVDPRLFYVYFLILLGVYAYSLLGIATSLSSVGTSGARLLAFLAVFTALHSPLFGYLARIGLGLPLASSPHHFNVGRILLLEGIGEKRILGDMLNPGTFGAFLLLSSVLFLRNRLVLAVTAAAVAAWVQPSYILPTGILILTYLILVARRGGGLRRPVASGAYAAGLLLPLVAYAAIYFRPTDPGLWRRAQEILIHVAYYPPSVPALWLGGTAYLKAGIVLAALYVVRRTELFWILLPLFVATVGLTALQMGTGSIELALLLPWRISALLVPVATVILVSRGVDELLDRLQHGVIRSDRVLAALGAAVMLVLIAAGLVETTWRFDAGGQGPGWALMRHIRATASSAQTYLIPPNWRSFRLATGAPVFAERSVIPYDEASIMEWYDRIRLADAFYGPQPDEEQYDLSNPFHRRRAERRQRVAAASGSQTEDARAPSMQARCAMLADLAPRYRITHVIVDGSLDGCAGWTLQFTDEPYRLYARER